MGAVYNSKDGDSVWKRAELTRRRLPELLFGE